MQTRQAIEAYNLIKTSKLTKMEDADKIKVIKAIRALKPIYTAYEDYIKEAQDRLKGEEHDDMTRRSEAFTKAHEKQRISDLTVEELAELRAINDYFNAYNKNLKQVSDEELDKEVTLDYPRLTEEAFSKFIASNDFYVEECIKVSEVLVA